MSISRIRNTQHKVYIPSSARENQYLLAKFKVTDELIAKVSGTVDQTSDKPYQPFYEKLSKLFFKICNEHGIDSCKLVGNDKFSRVRYSPERLTAQTKEQILFLYNPKYHTTQSAYYRPEEISKKITLVFLTNQDDIRADAPLFHKKVKAAIEDFSKEVALEANSVRVCDHQHLTYDLFAKDKGVTGSQTHKLRSMPVRYAASDVTVDESADTQTYVTVDLPISRRLKSLVEIDETESEPYSALYNLIADSVINAAKRHNLTNGAVIANGLVPFVRTSEEEVVVVQGELQKLGYNPENTGGGYTCKWSADKLVDTAQLIFVASKQHQTSHGFGKFLSQVEQALRTMSESLEYVTDKEELKVRFHQHIGFYM
ncbi:DUF3083 family protein [Thalassotalea sp. PLHSN55]|uniref:DUF3083 family protein n=1 Tax=Thalassotalea sp. PLHSN55 TaxID=3435888 RepID=UPI003F83FFD6